MAMSKDMLASATPILLSHEQKRAAALAVCTMVPREDVKQHLIDLGLYTPLKEAREAGLRAEDEQAEVEQILRKASPSARVQGFPRGALRY